jgi:hypothetical protein
MPRIKFSAVTPMFQLLNIMIQTTGKKGAGENAEPAFTRNPQVIHFALV